MTKINPEKLLGKREIKFRAWDKERKQMVYMSFDDKELIGKEWSYWGDCILGDDDYVVMQYTGLKDKNGREVYEGDIIKGKPHKASEEIVVGVVLFGEAFSSHDSGYIRERYIGWFIADVEGNQIYRYGESISLPNICKNGEVVGNVFENPELLEENGDS